MSAASGTRRIAEQVGQIEQAKRKADLLARICADRVLEGAADARVREAAERFRSADQREQELHERLCQLLDLPTD